MSIKPLSGNRFTPKPNKIDRLISQNNSSSSDLKNDFELLFNSILVIKHEYEFAIFKDRFVDLVQSLQALESKIQSLILPDQPNSIELELLLIKLTIFKKWIQSIDKSFKESEKMLARAKNIKNLL